MADALRPDETMRYERKFVTTDLEPQQVEMLIRLHPAFFREIHHERFVNNIYLDSLVLEAYWANVAGVARRLKSRIRWYGELFGRVEAPVLELKRKQALVGTKEAYALTPFTLDERLDVREAWEKAELPEGVRELLASVEPTLLNRYRRRYFLSADGVYRLTLDWGLQFYRIRRRDNCFLERRCDDRTVVVELKFAHGRESGAERISRRFPFRLSRFSKYVRGIDALHG